MSKLVTLDKTVQYSKKRIKSEDVTIENFISTDNILQNKLGITQATNLPPNGQAMPSYFEEDILVANIRPYLKKIWFADKNGGCSSDVLVFETKKGYFPKFIYYNLFRDDFFDFVMKGSKGTKMPRGDKNQILNYLIPDFELSTQKNIAKVLSDLDAKIELNNKINTELEAMAKTLYDYWFVQFDFPDANGKPYKTSGGKMVWNEELKREIPEGWEVFKINEIIEVKDGTHDSPKPKDEGFSLITSKNLKIEGLDFENANLISEEDYLSINKRSKVETGDILFSMIGNIGTIYKVEEKEINFAIKNVALYKTSQKEDYKNFIYMFLKSIDMDRYMKNVISGSIQKFIGLSSLRNTPIFINEELIKKFNEVTYPIFIKLEKSKLENQKIASLRDWLLPMLMNGQVSVGQVAKEYQMKEEVLGMVAESGVEYKENER